MFSRGDAVPVLTLLILLVCATTVFAGADPAHDLAITKNHRTLYVVQALNHASSGKLQVSPGDACEIYSAGSLGLVSQSSGKAIVEYRPALVFLHGGKLVNLWSAAKVGLGHFCPPGTHFELPSQELTRLDAARLLSIQDPVIRFDGEGMAWESRHLRMSREARKIPLGSERWAAIQHENSQELLASVEFSR